MENESPSHGSKARSAVIWNTGFNLFRDLLQFGTMLVLVRLLPPASYGELGLVTGIMGFIAIFSFNNFIAHTLQVKNDEDTHYQDHFTAGAVLQGAMFLITNIVAFILYFFPIYKPVAPLLHVLSLTFILEWPCEIRRKMIERQLDWKRLRLLHGIGLIASAALAVVMALSGAGTYALIIPGLLVTVPFIYDLFIRKKWRPNWSWAWKNYRPAWYFGVTRIGSGLAVNGRLLVESGALTALIGYTALGFFNRAIGLTQMFCQKFSMQLLYAIYPILTRITETDGTSARVGGLVLRLVTWTVVPVAVVFSTLASPVVRLVYGEQWLAVVPLLPWAMAWGALAAVTHASYMLLLARDQTRLCFITDLAILAGTCFALLFAFSKLTGNMLDTFQPFFLNNGTDFTDNIMLYLMIQILVQIIVLGFILNWLRLNCAITWGGIFNAFLPAVLSVAIAWFVSSEFLTVEIDDASTVLYAAFWGISFLLCYLFFIRLFFKRLLRDLVSYFPGSKILIKFFVF